MAATASSPVVPPRKKAIADLRTSVVLGLARFKERVRSSRRVKGWFLYVIAAALAVAASVLPNPQESVFADAARFAFDAQMRYLRERDPRPLANDIVLIGTDADSEKVFAEPMALWHRHFGKTFRALALAGPQAVGVDFGLPEKSFDWLVPGVDAPMMMGLVALKRRTQLVFVEHLRGNERVPVQENYRNIIGPENLGIDRQLKDPDGISRRFSERAVLDADRKPVPTLAGRILRQIGRDVEEGYIDYSVGHPLIRYIPMHDVVSWFDAKDEARLRATFAGKIVLIGGLGEDRDRWMLPVRLIERPEDRYGPRDPEGVLKSVKLSQPGVVIHQQVLRSHLSGGMLQPLPDWLVAVLCGIAGFAVLVRTRGWFLLTGAVILPAALVAASLFAIRNVHMLLPLAEITLVLWIALIVRGVFDAIEAVLERMRLQTSFAGQVSPSVMREMLGGGLSPGVSGQLADVCVLFSDIRDFTTLTEKMPPEIVTTVLQRYFDRMVRAVHRFDGTVDKFIGDGMMVLFGAPRKSEDPCGDAVQCALAMMRELDDLNAAFAAERLPTLTIGIGINYGKVTVGNIGSTERHNYSAIGDAVNVAARLEGLTKVLGRKILITEAVVSRIAERFRFDALGEHQVKGHSPVTIWGIRTARPAPS